MTTPEQDLAKDLRAIMPGLSRMDDEAVIENAREVNDSIVSAFSRYYSAALAPVVSATKLCGRRIVFGDRGLMSVEQLRDARGKRAKEA